MILQPGDESVLTALVSISTTLKNHFAFALLCFALTRKRAQALG
jgi:hypothetical protein